MFELKNYIAAFSSLHTAKVKGYKAPHKAILLLSIIDLVEKGSIASQHIILSKELENKFHEIWHRYLGNSAIFTPDIAKPYFHMQHESFWRLVEHKEVCSVMVAEEYSLETSRRGTKELPSGSYSIKAMRHAFAYAEIDSALYQLIQNADARAMLRVTLINTYLINQPTRTMPNLSALLVAIPLLTLVA